MIRSLLLVALTWLILASGIVARAAVEPVSKDQESNWICYTVPLPKAISIPGKLSLPKVGVAIAAPKEGGMVVDQAVKELSEILSEAGSGKPVLTIALELGGEDAKPLAQLKNSDQAYRIFPVGEDQLKLVALKPAGLYYASKTLQQLVRAKATRDQVEIPLVTVTDWPDLEDRGLWGSDNFLHLKWLADRKMNWMEQISDHGVDVKTKKPFARVRPDRMPLATEAPLYAIKFAPVVLHLEQSSQHGAIQAFPDIKGISGHHGVMCYSRFKVTEIISDWIAELAGTPNVNEVDVWMSENLQGFAGCQCSRCKATGVDPMVLEARAVVNAWRMARKRLGRDIGLRLLTSEATESANPAILAELPKEVKLVYYHSLRTYTSDKRWQMPKYLADFAKSGGWVATCPNVSAIVRYTQPFESAQFIRYRVQELVANNASGILGYSTPRVYFARYNTEATAEYAWNLQGRTTREFAYSWAVRNGLKDPGKFADFREIVGPVEWDCNGSDWPQRAHHKRFVPQLAEKLKLGEVPDFGYYTDGLVKAPFGSFSGARQLKHDVELANQALKLAKEMGVEEFIQESRVARGLITSLDALYELKGLVRDGKVAETDKPEAQRCFQTYVDSLREAIDALPKWEATVKMPADGIGRTNECIVLCQPLIKEMSAVAAELGCPVQ